MMVIYIGMQKTGTTYFQKEVFPKWNGIDYIGIPFKSNKCKDILLDFLSTDKQYDDEIHVYSDENIVGAKFEHFRHQNERIKNLAKLYPDAKIMISFRHHIDMVVSLYKEYIQSKGGVLDFEDFIDKNHGIITSHTLNFIKIINLVEENFNAKPFVFLQEEMDNNIQFGRLLTDMQDFIGGQAPDRDELSNNKINKGIGEKQIKLFKTMNKYLISDVNTQGYIPYTKRIRTLRNGMRLILNKFDDSFDYYSNQELKDIIDESFKQTIEVWEQDWVNVLKYMYNSDNRKQKRNIEMNGLGIVDFEE